MCGHTRRRRARVTRPRTAIPVGKERRPLKRGSMLSHFVCSTVGLPLDDVGGDSEALNSCWRLRARICPQQAYQRHITFLFLRPSRNLTPGCNRTLRICAELQSMITYKTSNTLTLPTAEPAVQPRSGGVQTFHFQIIERAASMLGISPSNSQTLIARAGHWSACTRHRRPMVVLTRMR